ncbi:MAG: PD-(D/E)XK nuclease family protein [Terriglobales bacterium]
MDRESRQLGGGGSAGGRPLAASAAQPPARPVAAPSGAGRLKFLADLAGGATIVTAGAHLARSLRQEYDASQLAQGRHLWPEAQITPWADWLRRRWCMALTQRPDLPYLASAAQEQALWEWIIARDEDLGGAAAALAPQAAAAWELSRAWRIAPGGTTAETEAFGRWAAAMERELRHRNWLTAAQLPDQLRELLAAGDLPAAAPGRLVPLGFAPLTPQQAAFFTAWAQAGGEARMPTPPAAESAPNGAAWQAAFPNEAAETEAAAQWAWRQLEAGRRSLGIVVVDLARRRAALERAFTLALEPAAWLPGAPATPLPFHLTLGPSLAVHPAIAAALRLLRALLPGAAMSAAEAEALLRTPYLRDAAAERSARGRAAAVLGQARQMEVPLAELLRVAAVVQADRWLDALRRSWQTAAQWPAQQAAAGWAHAFSAALAAAGWPGEGPDSGEYQAIERWQALLEEFSSLDALDLALTAAQAHEWLAAQAESEIFQPEAGAAPVEILSPDASPGLEFDAVWFLGAEAAAWPPPARLDPWLPAAAQRSAGVPRATPEVTRQWAGDVTERLRAGTAEAVFSFAPPEGAEYAAASPLIRALPAYPSAVESLWPATVSVAPQESIPDQRVPARPGAGGAVEVGGGAAIFTDQSQCPFRAFARHRLGASILDAPAPGLDAAARGQLLHAALFSVFRALADPQGRVTIPDPAECAERAQAAARAAVAEARGPAMAALRSRAFAALETGRLAETVREWLVEVEARRGPFSVAFAEEKRPGELGGLRLHWRADRVDRLSDGQTAILDFKSGRQQGPKDWAGDRPRDLQLPLYAQLADPPPTALAFAIVRVGEMGFKGVAAEEGLLPGCKPPKDTTWPDQLAAWRRVLGGLAGEFLAGRADVAPQAHACDGCELPALCRVGELGLFADADGEEESADGE